MAKIKSKKPTGNRKGLPPQLEEASDNLNARKPKVTAAKKDLNFKVDPEFKKRFKTYAATRDISMVELLSAAFEFYEKNHR